jgi:hypothetical protein
LVESAGLAAVWDFCRLQAKKNATSASIKRSAGREGTVRIGLFIFLLSYYLRSGLAMIEAGLAALDRTPEAAVPS